MKKLVAVLLVLCMVFAFAACGKEKEPEKEPEKKILNISREGDMTEQDWYPHMKLNAVAKNLTMLPAIEALFNVKADGTLVPQLAEKWDVSEDGKVWTFYLRKGVKFHDGTDFNAEVAKWNLDEAKAAAADATTYNGDMEKCEVIDANTIKVTFSTAYATQMLNMDTWMYSKAAYEKNGKEWAAKNPVGTGPFKFDHLTIGSEMVYVKNPDYYIEGQPKLDGITFKVIKDNTVLQAAYKNGEVDFIYSAGTTDLVETLLNTAGSVQMVSAAHGGHRAFFPTTKNTAKAADGTWDVNNIDYNYSPFADVRVRQAMAYAIDMDKIVSSVLDPKLNLASNQVCPANNSLFFNTEVKGYPYNPEKAKELLKEAGYGEGGKVLDVNIVTENSTLCQLVCQAIQAQLIEVGIKAEVTPMDGAAYFSNVVTGTWEPNWIVDMACNYMAYCPLTKIGTLMGAANKTLYPFVAYPDEWTDNIVKAVAQTTLEDAAPYLKAANKYFIDEYCGVIAVQSAGSAQYMKDYVKGYTQELQYPEFGGVDIVK